MGCDDYPLGEHPGVPTRSGVPYLLSVADAATAELQRLRDENLELRKQVEQLTTQRDDMRWRSE